MFLEIYMILLTKLAPLSPSAVTPTDNIIWYFILVVIVVSNFIFLFKIIDFFFSSSAGENPHFEQKNPFQELSLPSGIFFARSGDF